MANATVRLKRLDQASPQVRPLLDVVNLIADDLEARGARISEIDPERMISTLSDGGIASLGVLLSGRRFILMLTRERES